MDTLVLLVPVDLVSSFARAARQIDSQVRWIWLNWHSPADQSDPGEALELPDRIRQAIGSHACDYALLPELDEPCLVDLPGSNPVYGLPLPCWLVQPSHESYRDGGQQEIRLYLQMVYWSWQTRSGNTRQMEQLRESQKQLAEYASLCSIMGDLISQTRERDVLRKIIETFQTFFQPAECRFWSHEEVAESESRDLIEFCQSGERCRLVTSDGAEGPDGFLLSIAGTDILPGVLKVGQLAFPQYLNRYLNFALSIAQVAGMVIINARRYEALMRSEKLLAYRSRHDPMTDLYNRQAFNEQIDQMASHCHEWPAAIFMCDLNGLKKANDVFGHLQGDRLICRVADVLRQSFREEDFIARIGGDEFAVLLPGCPDAKALAIRRRLMDHVAEHNKEHHLPISLAVGYAIWETAGHDVDPVLMQADQVMYEVKARMKQEEAARQLMETLPEHVPAILPGHADAYAPGLSGSELQHKDLELFQVMLNGYALHELIVDDEGQPSDYRFVDMNPAFETMTGLSRQACAGKTVLECLPGTEPHWISLYGRVVLTGRPIHFESYSKAIDKHFEIYAYRPMPGYFATIVLDITQRKRMQEELADSEARYKAMIANISEVIAIVDSQFVIRYISPNVERSFGWQPRELMGVSALSVIVPAEHARVESTWDLFLASQDEQLAATIQIQHKDGSLRTVQLLASNRMEHTLIQGVLVSLRDITEQTRSEEHLLYLRDHDALTGLYNRRYLEDRLQQISGRDQMPFSYLLGDVNALRLINHSFGHLAGNMTLCTVAEILRKFAPQQAVLARVGGDEFAMLLPRTDADEVYGLCQLINRECSLIIDQQDRKSQYIFPSLALGFATQTSPDQTIRDIILQAEKNLYRRKLFESESVHGALLASIKATMFAKSFETEAHAERMLVLSADLGHELGLNGDQMHDLSLLASLHDVGKIGIDDRILRKPGRLSEDEWIEMRKHPEIGKRIAESMPELEPIAELVLCHHERWDGKGYPAGLSGTDIPLLSRIVAVIDAFDAMTQDRPYRNRISVEDALSEIERCAGTQFDPEIVRRFVSMIEHKMIGPQARQQSLAFRYA